MTDYLRNRPFLAVQITQRPAANANTKVKGWQNEPGALVAFERVSFVDRIKNVSDFAVVIDIINSAVIVNKSSRSENEVMATYLGKYRDEVTQALTVWAQKEARNLAAKEVADADSN